MASFDLLKNGTFGEFDNIYDYYKNELIKSQFINNEWHQKEGHMTIDNQLKRDCKGNMNYIINGIEYFRDKYSLNNNGYTERFNNIKSHIERLIIEPNKLQILKYIMCQSSTTNVADIINRLLNIYNISIDGLPDSQILIYIQIVNNNIIVDYQTFYGIKHVDDNDNGRTPCASITTKTYINYNENKVIGTILSITTRENLDKSQTYVKKISELKKQIDLYYKNKTEVNDYKFYKIITLNFSECILKLKKNNMNSYLTYNNKHNNNSRVWTFKIDNKTISLNSLKHNENLSNNPNNLDYIKQFLFTQYEISISLNYIFSKLLNNNNEYFRLHFTQTKKEKNLFSHGIFITEYYYEIYYKRDSDEIKIAEVYCYNIANLTDKTYKIYFHLNNIDIITLLKLKIKFKDSFDLNKIFDNILSFYTNINVLPNLNEILRKITIGRNIKPPGNTINNFLNNITQTLPILNKNKLFPSKQSDFLLISFNEAAQSYNNSDCLPMIIKVLTEKPKIIVVCTQDSASKRLLTTHYQHVLGEILIKLQYKRIEKVDGSSNEKNMETSSTWGKLGKLAKGFARSATVGLTQYNKGIRTRVYFLSDFEKNQLPTSQPLSNSKQLLLGTFAEKSLYDGAILTKLNFKVATENYKIAIINCNLFYKHQPKTGVEKRIEEFNRIVEEFKLIDLNKDYDIFFCGDTNFRLFTHTKTNSNVNSFDIIRSRNIVKSYIVNKKSLNKSNEFYRILKKKLDNFEKLSKIIQKSIINLKKSNNTYKNQNISRKNKIKYQNLKEKLEEKLEYSNFYEKLLQSMELLGTHLTAKYTIDKTRHMYKEQLKLFRILNHRDTINTSINNVFKIKGKSLLENKNIRVPSQTDRILFALKNKTSIAIDSNDFNIHLFPDKSDHKMISLTFNFESIRTTSVTNLHSPRVINNNNNNNTVLQNRLFGNNQEYQNIEITKKEFIEKLFRLINSESQNNIVNFKTKLTELHTKYTKNLQKSIVKETVTFVNDM